MADLRKERLSSSRRTTNGSLLAWSLPALHDPRAGLPASCSCSQPRLGKWTCCHDEVERKSYLTTTPRTKFRLFTCTVSWLLSVPKSPPSVVQAIFFQLSLKSQLHRLSRDGSEFRGFPMQLYFFTIASRCFRVSSQFRSIERMMSSPSAWRCCDTLGSREASTDIP